MGPLPRPERPVPLDVQSVGGARQATGLCAARLRTTPIARTSVCRAWLLLPTGDDVRPRPAVLCLHQTTPSGKDSPVGLSDRPSLHYALELAQRGFVTLVARLPVARRTRARLRHRRVRQRLDEGDLRQRAGDRSVAVACRSGLRAHRLHRPFAWRPQRPVHGRVRRANQSGRDVLRIHDDSTSTWAATCAAGPGLDTCRASHRNTDFRPIACRSTSRK